MNIKNQQLSDNTLIFTVGNSDVQTSNPDVFHPDVKTFKNRYQKNTFLFSMPMLSGKTILKNPDKYLPHLHFPIIDNCLRFLFTQFPDVNNNNLTVFLVSTRQPKSAPHSHRDSFEFANVILYYLQTSHRFKKENLHHVTVKNENLIHYDRMFLWFQKRFNKNKISGRIFLLPQGGIDAINFNLMLYCIRKYPDLVQLFVDENNNVSVLNFPHQIRYFSFIQPLLENYNYEQLANIQWLAPDLINLFSFLKAKFNRLPASDEKLPADLPETLTKKLQSNDRLFWLELYLFIALHNRQTEMAVLTFFVIHEMIIDKEFHAILNEKYGFVSPQNHDFLNLWKSNYNFFAINKKTPRNYPNLVNVFKDLEKADPQLTLKDLNLKVKTTLIELHKKELKIDKKLNIQRNLFVHELKGISENDKAYFLDRIDTYMKSKRNEIIRLLEEINNYVTQKFLKEKT